MESFNVTTSTQANLSNVNPLITSSLSKKINNEKDVIHFKSLSPAHRNIQTYIEALCDLIQGTGNNFINCKYVIKDETYQKCSELLDQLDKLCDSTDLTQTKSTASLRFGHIAFRDWYDATKSKCKEFIDEKLAPGKDELLKEELLVYLTESFGNRMRIDYGTGHELNFILFTMGLVYLVSQQNDPSIDSTRGYSLTPEILKSHVKEHGWDIHALFAHKYLRICRNVQKKFRLEPAGSRGVYNMDDYQFLPFLFGVAQLADVKYISCKNFYDYDQVDLWKNDFMFFEAVDYILKNKRGPFNEHSYTLWCMSGLESWLTIYRKIKVKFIDDVLSSFPIIQHLLFGRYILKWD